MDNLERVESVDQFVKVVSSRARTWQAAWDLRTESSWLPWFRGEEIADWPTALKPKLYRTKHKLKEILRQEQDFRLEFKRRGSQFIGEGKPSDHWERYFLMQHYGVPTRLLDWSDGALVALYFGLKRVRSSQDAAVYMLDPWWLNDLVYKELPLSKAVRPRGTALPDWEEAKAYLSEDEFENQYLGPRFPLAIDPSHVARRFAAQRSRFLIFGRQSDGLTRMCAKVKKSELPIMPHPDQKIGRRQDAARPRDVRGLRVNDFPRSRWFRSRVGFDVPGVVGCELYVQVIAPLTACHTYSSASGRVCCFTVRSVCPAFRANTN